MKKTFSRVYQFKIVLNDINPSVWRRIQVPETYTFWDLHIAIQDAMGWQDYHLHEFEIKNPLLGIREMIGIPDEEMDIDKDILPDWEQKISEYFTMENPEAVYMYDFGNNWEHLIKLEKILPREKGRKYPECIDGQRACPPEDCGGPHGYEEFLEIIMEPGHDRYEEMLQWAGGDFEPEHFDPGKVLFDNPKKRFKMAFG